MVMSPEKKMRVRQGAILGLIVGVFIFIFFALVNSAQAWMYVMFIPIACGMGAAVQYVKDDSVDDDD
jgi:uncharacterized membrane protein